MKKIVVVGSLNMDLVSSIETMPKDGETITGTSFSMHSGGKGANQAVAIGRLGGKVDMIGALGEDAFGEKLEADLASAGVGTAGIKRVAGSSGCATILVTESGSNCIVVHPGANATLHAEDLGRRASSINEAAIVPSQLETPLHTVMHLAEITSAAQIAFFLDPAPIPAEPLPSELLKRVTWFTPNETETAALLGHYGQAGMDLTSDDGVERAAAVLLSAGPRNVIIKRGSKGIFMCGADCATSNISGHRVIPVDTTAAGDAFNGAFAFALANGKPPTVAAEFACMVAAFSVTRRGAQSSMPSMRDLTNWQAMKAAGHHS